MKILPMLLLLKFSVAAGLGAWAFSASKGYRADSAKGAEKGNNPGAGPVADPGSQPDSAVPKDTKAEELSFFDKLIAKIKGEDSNQAQPVPAPEQVMAKNANASPVAEKMRNIPDLPPSKAGLTELSKARRQLEMMRQDVEEKMVRLKLATETYEISKNDSEEKLKIIKEEKQLLEETLQKEKTVQKERIDEALTFIEKMEPKKAAPVLEQMDRDLVIALFKKLKPKTVTKFLEGMNPKKATEYMEYYTKIRSGREYELLRDLKMCESTDIPEDAEK